MARPKRCVALVQIAYQRTCLCPGNALACVDFDPVHTGEIDHQAAIAHAESGSVMASATHRQRQILVLGEFKRSRDVGRTGTANDQRRTPIECAVENQACRFIVGRLRCDYVPANLGTKFSDRRCIERSGILFACFEDPPSASKHLNRTPVKRRSGERRLLDELSSSSERHIRLHQLSAASLTCELRKRHSHLEFAFVTGLMSCVLSKSLTAAYRRSLRPQGFRRQFLISAMPVESRKANGFFSMTGYAIPCAQSFFPEKSSEAGWAT